MMRMVSEEKDSVLTGLLVAALVFTAVKRSYHGKFVVCVLKAVARQVRCWARLARAKAGLPPAGGVCHAREMTAAWLTEQLRRAGALADDNRVVKFGPVGVESDSVSFSSQSGLLALEYERAERGAPARIFFKTTDTPFVHRLFLGPVSGCWRREVGFYQRLAPELSGVIRVPRCFYAAHDPATEDFLLLLEDMSPAKPLDTHLSAFSLSADMVRAPAPAPRAARPRPDSRSRHPGCSWIHVAKH